MNDTDGYTAVMQCCEDEFIGMTDVNLCDDRGRHMYTSCQLVDDDDPEVFAQIIKDMNEWCLNNREPRLVRNHRALWYKIG